MATLLASVDTRDLRDCFDGTTLISVARLVLLECEFIQDVPKRGYLVLATDPREIAQKKTMDPIGDWVRAALDVPQRLGSRLLRRWLTDRGRWRSRLTGTAGICGAHAADPFSAK